jgi:uncharacterized protein YciI
MRHFIIEITYLVPFEQLGATVAEHRAFLQTGYDLGLLLFSGPQNPKTGGIVVARAKSSEEIQAFFAKDPYALSGKGKHRFVEFEPVKNQPFLAEWITG